MSRLITAPPDAIATNPKASFSEDLWSFFKREIPNDNANKKGTAKIPVVAPDASNEIAKKSSDVPIASTPMMR